MGAYRFSTDDLAEMTPEQRDAVLDALVMAVLPEGGDDDFVRSDALATVVGAVPWGRSMEEVARMVQGTRSRVQGMRSDERRAMLRGVAARLATPDARAKVLAVVGQVVVADRLADFAQAFGRD